MSHELLPYIVPNEDLRLIYPDEVHDYAARLHTAIENNKSPAEITAILNEEPDYMRRLAFDVHVGWGALILDTQPAMPMIAMTLAVEKGNTKVIDVLHAYGSRVAVDVTNRNILLPITLAAAHENADLFHHLFQKLQNYHKRDLAVGLAIHQACRLKMSWAVKFLIDMGVNFSTPKLPMTTLDWAAHDGAYKSMALLIRRGARVDNTPLIGTFRSPLEAAERGLVWYRGELPWAKGSIRVLKEEIQRKKEGRASMLQEYLTGDYITEYGMKRLLYWEEDRANAYEHSPEFLEFRQLFNNPKCDQEYTIENRRFLVLWAKLFGKTIPPSEQWVQLRETLCMKLMQHLRERHEPTLSDSWKYLRLINHFGNEMANFQRQHKGFRGAPRLPPLGLAHIEEETLEEACNLAYQQPNDGHIHNPGNGGNILAPDKESQDAKHKEVSDPEGDNVGEGGLAFQERTVESDKENRGPEEDDEEDWLKFLNSSPRH